MSEQDTRRAQLYIICRSVANENTYPIMFN